jgi:hypothetical protein
MGVNLGRSNLTEEPRLMVLRRIFRSERDEVKGEWRKIHNEELNDLYSYPTFFV